MKRGMRFAKRTATPTKLSKRIGWLNKHGGLAQEIRYSDVKELLTEVGDREAMRILGQLEEKDRSVRDPTAYLKASALRILDSGGGEGGGQQARKAPRDAPISEAMLAQKVEKRVQWMNANANLVQDLSLDEVGHALVTAGQRQAMQVLKDLEENAQEILDPNSFVQEMLAGGAGAAAAPQEGRPGADGDAGGEGEEGRGGGRRRRGKRASRGRHVLKTGLKEKPESTFSEQVRKRIEWLNRNRNLQQELEFSKVGDLLIRTGDKKVAMGILKELEDNAPEVRNPNAYVAHRAKLALGELVKPEGGKKRAKRSSTESDVLRQIRWMNEHVPLAVPLELDRVIPFFQDLDVNEAMGILHRLEQSSTEVRDPNAYVIAAAKRVLADSAAPEPMPPPPPPMRREQAREAYPPRQALPALPAPTPSSVESKLMKRIDWLNSHVALNAPLIFERVAPELLSVDLLTSLEVLNNLEENAEDVRDPNAYVVSRVRRQAGGSVPGPSPRSGARPSERSMPPPPLPPPPPAAMEERLVKRLTWLNRNVCPDAPVDLDQVVPALLPLPRNQAMDVLKNFEETAPEVRNPTAFVIAAARRAMGGDVRNDRNDRGDRGDRGSGRQAIGSAGSSRPPSRPSSASSASRMPIGTGSSRASSRSSPMMALPGAPAMDEKITYYEGAEEKLRKRIDWLNMNVPMASPLAAERVTPELLKVRPREAMEILKRLEETAHEVRDPTGYVISMARRRFSGPGR